MLFNSVEFFLFFTLVYLLYWLIFSRRRSMRNAFILICSYVFYGWWDWRFLVLIIFSSFVDYFAGILLQKEEGVFRRKLLLGLSVFTNVGLLFFFKYSNFFVESFIETFSFLGFNLHFRTLNIILPVGISFYTFQTLSYTIDVYRGKMKATDDILAYFAYVAFFPQLVAGPIERASRLLPQFFQRTTFNYQQSVEGLRRILWGLFKKVVVADSCAVFVDATFSNYAELSGSTLMLGAIFFAFQIYGDFSGYSDIAIGTAKLLGFQLMENFRYPYFSRDIAEFWRRWHISLSTWFRDYVYIPLGGSRGTRGRIIRNVMVVFLISGLWHGANWTFVVWGLLNAIYFLPLILSNKNRNHLDTVAKDRIFPSLRESRQIIVTFLLTSLGWVFFRAESIGHAGQYLRGIFSLSLFTPVDLDTKRTIFVLFMLAIEWFHRDKEYAFSLEFIRKPRLRWAMYYLMIFVVFYFSSEKLSFIYFQF